MNKADLAMIPIENSTAGRVSDIHFLIQNTKLKIVAEYYQKSRTLSVIKQKHQTH